MDGETLKAGSTKQVGAAQTIVNLKSEIASLKSQLAQAQASASGAQSTANDSARQITQLKKDLADAQAQLKTAQEQAASQGSTLTAPAKVTNLKVKAGKRSAKLTWTEERQDLLLQGKSLQVHHQRRALGRILQHRKSCGKITG